MKITGRSKCYFVTWIPEDIHIIVVDFEPMFWLKRMEAQLKNFYLNNMLPCIINDDVEYWIDVEYSLYESLCIQSSEPRPYVNNESHNIFI